MTIAYDRNDPRPESAALKLSGVSLCYQGNSRPVLEGIDLEVFHGELLSLLGPSGCGKSSLLRIVAGLIQPTTGSVRWATGQLPRLGFVFQDPALMPWLTVEQNVAEPLRLGPVRTPEADVRARVADALALVRLDGHGHARPHELSGGMRMRVSIARALVARPDFLLMDEPFAALDEFSREQLNEDLLRLREERALTILFVTHSIQEAIFLSDRIIVLTDLPGTIRHSESIERDFPAGQHDREGSVSRGIHRKLRGLIRFDAHESDGAAP